MAHRSMRKQYCNLLFFFWKVYIFLGYLPNFQILEKSTCLQNLRLEDIATFNAVATILSKCFFKDLCLSKTLTEKYF